MIETSADPCTLCIPNAARKPAGRVWGVWGVWAAVFYLGFGLAGAAQAKSFVPKDDTEIVETVASNAALQGLKRMRAALARDPENFELATRVARRLIETSRAEGDPRYLGYAQAALAKWWQGSAPELVLLRATIRQSVHEFDAALDDLRQLTRKQSGGGQGLLTQALLTQATIEQVLGHYGDAQKSCEALNSLNSNLVAQACLADVRSLQGDASVIEPLRARLETDRGLDAPTQGWLHTLLAEMLERRSQTAMAEQHYAAALKLVSDLYTRAAFADLLLAQGRAQQALEALALNEKSVPDVLLLRQVLALHALGRQAQLKPALAELRARLSSARERGANLHGREEARLLLVLDNNPPAALRVAQDNWAVQKEPADTLVLAQAALAAADGKTIESIKQFVLQTGFYDQRLNELLAARGQPK